MVVTPVIVSLVLTNSVPRKVVTPISTLSTGLPRTDPITIFAPVPLVPLLSRSNRSSTLYPSPLEKIVTEEIPALFVLVTSNPAAIKPLLT